jgi:glycerol uptake facilitator-like aquaporin
MIRRLAAEGLGTALLLAIVVGSGIMGERLSPDNAAVALLGNSLATGAGLFVLIVLFAPVSGSHFNPAVTLALTLARALSPKEAIAYVIAQFLGACTGVIAAHAMFGLALWQTSLHERSTAGEWLGEAIATLGLILIVRMLSPSSKYEAGGTIALWITAAYWFTSSTSFANPAVTLARSLTDTFAGIAPGSVLPFVGVQLVSAALAVWVAGRFVKPN